MVTQYKVYYSCILQFELTLNPQINCRLLYFLSASILKVLQYRSNLVKMLSKCQNSLSLDEMLSYSGVSSRSKLFAYGILVVIGGQRVKVNWGPYKIKCKVYPNYSFLLYIL